MKWSAARVWAAVLVALAAAAAQEPAETGGGRVRMPVTLEGSVVYVALGADEAAARAESERVAGVIERLRGRPADAERVGLRERDGRGILVFGGQEVLEIAAENRAWPELSPLANALELRERIMHAAGRAGSWDEEELMVRLFLGLIYPVALLVALRLTRTGMLRWEREWRREAYRHLLRIAERRGYPVGEAGPRRLIGLLVGLERLALYGLVVILFTFTWFALFPQTRPLASMFLQRIIAPLIELLGLTARTLLLFTYSAVLLLLGYLLNRYLARTRLRPDAPAVLTDPLLFFFLRLAVGLSVLFLVLFPYPGVPRLIAVGILLLTFLTAVLAARPLVEEVASGMYLTGTYGLRRGERLSVDGEDYQIEKPGLVHIQLVRDGESIWVPYSRLLRSRLRIYPGQQP